MQLIYDKAAPVEISSFSEQMEQSLEITEKEEQQKKHYLLQNELQTMARELPA